MGGIRKIAEIIQTFNNVLFETQSSTNNSIKEGTVVGNDISSSQGGTMGVSSSSNQGGTIGASGNNNNQKKTIINITNIDKRDIINSASQGTGRGRMAKNEELKKRNRAGMRYVHLFVVLNDVFTFPKIVLSSLQNVGIEYSFAVANVNIMARIESVKEKGRKGKEEERCKNEDEEEGVIENGRGKRQREEEDKENMEERNEGIRIFQNSEK
jgi:hypothetical protein